MPRVIRSLALAGGVSLLLSGCAGIVPMTAAPDANNPLCAEVIVRLGSVDGLSKRETNAQATAAWGEPSSVLLTCGVTPPGPSTLSCLNVNGVDWLMDDAHKPTYRFTTFGRTPAVEVIVDAQEASGSAVLADLTSAVAEIPQSRQCLGPGDVAGG